MTMTEERSGWERINESERADYYIQTLATLTGWEFAKEYKQRSYQLLGLNPGDTVLDMGCGLGEDVIQLAEIVGERGLAYGVDLSQDMITRALEKAAERNLPQIRFALVDAAKLPFPDNHFRGCRADRVLQHLANRERALSEMVRVLQPGGRMVCIDPDWETLVFDLPDRDLTRKISGAICDRVRNGWAGHQSPRMFLEAGLVEIAVQPITSILHDIKLARAVLELDIAFEELQRDNILSPEEIARWFETVNNANDSGRFFAAMSGFMVLGRKPEYAY